MTSLLSGTPEVRYSEAAELHGHPPFTSRYQGMNACSFKGTWHILKGKVFQSLGNLTDDHERYDRGRREELIGKFLKRTNMSSQEVKNLIKRL